MSVLICGSIAYDNIMVFEDSFKNHILPDQIHILNVSFLVPELRREFGGCALNIAYNLKLLGEEPLPMGTAGRDFTPYQAWLEEHGFKYHEVLYNKPRGGNYHWVDNHTVRATRFNSKFTEFVKRWNEIEVFDDVGQANKSDSPHQ